jgi:flagellum-specific peptidoglycan hydrolase FlgJ
LLEWVDSVTGLVEVTGVAASFTVAEVALESAWGASQLARQGAISQFLDAWQ